MEGGLCLGFSGVLTLRSQVKVQGVVSSPGCGPILGCDFELTMEITELSIFRSLKMRELKSLHLEHNQRMPVAAFTVETSCRVRGPGFSVGFCPPGAAG